MGGLEDRTLLVSMSESSPGDFDLLPACDCLCFLLSRSWVFRNSTVDGCTRKEALLDPINLKNANSIIIYKPYAAVNYARSTAVPYRHDHDAQMMRNHTALVTYNSIRKEARARSGIHTYLLVTGLNENSVGEN